MRCDRCHGTGKLWFHEQGQAVPIVAVCPDCIGGVSSCCEVHDDPEAQPKED